MRSSVQAHVAMLLLVCAASSCGDDKACSIDADCFQGESCIDERCAVGQAPANAMPNNTQNNAQNNTTNQSNNTSSNATNGTNVSGDCVVAVVGNSCNEDQFEAEDTGSAFKPLLWDNQSWCDMGTLVPTQTSDSLALCAGDTGDRFRVMIDNRIPDECITRQFTWTVEVRVETPCESDLLVIKPYFDTSTEASVCENESWRCAWNDDETVFTIDYVRQPDQLMDWNLFVGPADGRSDIQIEYDVVMTITQ